ncbi:MAG TPA: chloride channel protein [bacterium]|nr:chloride channel protein [bacterium]
MNSVGRIGAFLIGFSRRESTVLIIAAVGIGMFSGMAYLLFSGLIELLSRLLLGVATSDAVNGFRALPLPLRILLPLAGVSAGGFLIRYFSKESAGTGVGLLLKTIRLKNGILPHLLAPFKLVTAALSIACGAPLGLEGPVIVISSSIGSSVGQLLKVGYSRMKLLLGCGSAAGLAVAFNAPIAGTIFAVETVMGNYAIGTLTPVVVAAATASFFGAYFLPGHEALPFSRIAQIYGADAVSSTAIHSATEIFLYLALGIICALMGVALIKATAAVTDRLEPIKKRIPEYLHAPLILLPFALVVPFVPSLFGLGKDVIVDGFAWGPWVLVGIALLKLVFLPIAFSSGASGGIFFPILFVGFIFGLGFGKLMPLIFFDLPVGSAYSFAAVGTGALLGAATQEPITSFLLVFEITRDYTILPALMLATVVSVFISRSLSSVSIYNYQLVREGIMTDAGEETSLMHETKVEVCYKKDCVRAAPHEPLSAVVDRMREMERFEAYVVDADGRYLGAINAVLTSSREVQYGLISPVVVANDLINTAFPTVRPGDSIAQAMRKTAEYDVIEIPVVSDDGKLLGCIHEHDIIAFYEREILSKAHLVKMVGQHEEQHQHQIRLAGDFVIETITAQGELVGRNLIELKLRQRFGVQVLAVREKGSERGIIEPERLLAAGDTLIVAGRREEMAALRAAFNGE